MSSLHEKPEVRKELSRHSAETAKSAQASSSWVTSDLPFLCFCGAYHQSQFADRRRYSPLRTLLAQ
jgi:hypothetical protein